ncbi:MAG: DUF3365 domain-containing protein [Thiotrichales bacterium]|nr:DUF3365 domain-containing protein [Thiotrichales bacterium]
MKKIGLALVFALSPLTTFANEPSNIEAREIAKQFAGQLQPELKKGMQNGGPVNAIGVCHSKAPQIAHDLTKSTGWNINRVSLKPRGASAQPDTWEAAVMEKFNAQLASGADVKTIEFSEVVSLNGQKTFRYMKAIPTGEVCLKCHGTDVVAPVKEAIHKFYPQDTATGYKMGEIRGAFSFSKAL